MTSIAEGCSGVEWIAMHSRDKSARTLTATSAALISGIARRSKRVRGSSPAARCLAALAPAEPPAPLPARLIPRMPSKTVSILGRGSRHARTTRAAFLHIGDFEIPTFIS
jgi:hypothetical protein